MVLVFKDFDMSVFITILVSSNHLNLCWGIFSLLTVASIQPAEHGTSWWYHTRRNFFVPSPVVFFEKPIEIPSVQMPCSAYLAFIISHKWKQLNSRKPNFKTKKTNWLDILLVTNLNSRSMVDILKIMLIQLDNLVTNRQIFLIRNWPFINRGNKNP